jgi:aryl-alcohol dehydrogenase-like predicted oxidoreductase
MTDMEYRPLGRTGIQVSKLCLGTMMLAATVFELARPSDGRPAQAPADASP